MFGIAVAHVGDIGQANGTTAPDRNPRIPKPQGIARVAENANRLFGTGNFGAATRGVDVDPAQFGVDLRRGKTKGLHPARIENDADFTADAAAAAHLRHAGDGEQALGNGVVDEPAELFERHIDRLHRHIGNGAA